MEGLSKKEKGFMDMDNCGDSSGDRVGRRWEEVEGGLSGINGN